MLENYLHALIAIKLESQLYAKSQPPRVPCRLLYNECSDCTFALPIFPPLCLIFALSPHTLLSFAQLKMQINTLNLDKFLAPNFEVGIA